MESYWGVNHGEEISKLRVPQLTKEGKKIAAIGLGGGGAAGGAAGYMVARKKPSKKSRAATTGAGATGGLLVAGPFGAVGGGAGSYLGHRAGSKRRT